MLRNLTIACYQGNAAQIPDPGQTGHGVWIQAQKVTLDHVTIEYFGEHGVFIDAGFAPPATVNGSNAAGFQLLQCSIGLCGLDGIHVRGSDANVGLVSCCTVGGCAGWGYNDETSGNTYVGCHGEGNRGYGQGYERSYRTGDTVDENGVLPNGSIFVGCYTEAPAKNEITKPAMIVGGDLSDLTGNSSLTTTIAALDPAPGGDQLPPLNGLLALTSAQGFPPAGSVLIRCLNAQNTLQQVDYTGVVGNTLTGCTSAGSGTLTVGDLVIATVVPLERRGFSVGPEGNVSGSPLLFENTLGHYKTLIEIGQTAREVGGVLNFSLPGGQTVFGRAIADTNVLRFDETSGWWGIDNTAGNIGRTSIRFPSTVIAPRKVAPLFENGIFLGRTTALSDITASRTILNHTNRVAAPSPVDTIGGTWELGDVAWNGAPTTGSPAGWTCRRPGTDDAQLVGITGTFDATGTILTLSAVPGNLAQWQYVELGTLPPTAHQVVSDPGHPPAPLVDGQIIVDPAGPANGGPFSVTYRRTKFLAFGQTFADLTGDSLAAASVDLLLPDGDELALADDTSYAVRVRLLGSDVTSKDCAYEVHEMLVHTTGGALTIDDDTTIASKNTPGWGFAITAPAADILRITCQGGGNTVHFSARVEWTALPNV